MCSVIQGDNNLLRPLFKCHFCRYQLEGIQVYDGGWQVALIGAYSSTYVGGYDSNGSSSSWTLSQGTRASRKTTTTQVRCASGQQASTQHSGNERNTVCLKSGPCTGGLTVKRKPEDESSQFRFSLFRLQVRVETGTDRHLDSDCQALYLCTHHTVATR